MFQPIANPGQNANNALKRYGSDDVCCNDYPDACQYDVTIPTAATVNNIIYKPTAASDPVTIAFTAVGGAAVVAAVKAGLIANGYEEDSDEVAGITSEVVSTNTIYHTTGSLIIVSMTHTTSTVVAAVEKCDRVGICDFYVEIPGGAANVFAVNGVDEDLGSLTLVGNTAAEVVTAIEGATAWPSGYTVAVVETATAFEITINGPGPIVFEWNGEQFTKQNCVAGYIA